MDRITRINKLQDILKTRIVLVDGAMGTSIQALNLTSADFGGETYDGCNEYLNITKPNVIKDIHRSFLEAGADIIETNSFGSTALVLSEYSNEIDSRNVSKTASELARDVADEFLTESWPRFVAGSMGPTTKAITVTGGVTWDELVEHYKMQASGLIEGGSDMLLIETSQDTINVKACLEGIDRAQSDLGMVIPVAVQCTIETMGTTLGGQDIEAFYTSIAHRNLLWVGLNCATGPEFMRDHLRTLSSISRFPVSVIPNAGLPDENGNYNETPESIANTIDQYLESGWANIIGGCCGTTPAHIQKLHKIIDGKKSSSRNSSQLTVISGLEALTIDQDNRPIIVGERTNVLGSRRFKRLIAEGKIEEASEIGRRQVRNGAHVLDICLQDPDRDEIADMTSFLEILTRKIKAPLVIDSTSNEVIEEALKRTPGKSIINSINLEDGEDRFKTVVPIARRYGAALIVGCIDDDKLQAQAITKERKLAIAERATKLLTEDYGILSEDIIFDPLVFPIGTGDQNYIGAGIETIEGVRLIKSRFPNSKTILGISNVSFGLPPAGREVLNSVFLYHCVLAGLDMAIVNSQGMMRYASIPKADREICEDLIWWRGKDPIRTFADHFRERKIKEAPQNRKNIPIERRVANCIIEGTKEGLIEDLDELVKNHKPLDIINGPLMKGMDEVGRLFNQNELIVAEVLESAEAMKAAVTHLESYMESSTETNTRGTIILATVKGDVHDIGKNLVDIILSNNGYKVINLGIRVPPYDLIQAYRDYQPDIIGLSGLLVKSAQMMVETAKDFQAAGLDVPILVGGAALTNRFARLRIAPEYRGPVIYSRDAMTGLDLTRQLLNDTDRQKLVKDISIEFDKLVNEEAIKIARQQTETKPREIRPSLPKIHNPHIPPDLKQHILKDYDLSTIFSYINPAMLYVRHLGFRGKFQDRLDQGDKKAMELYEQVKNVEEFMLGHGGITANATYKFFRAASDGDDIIILSPNGESTVERFQLGRQRDGEFLCLSDYLNSMTSGTPDYIGMFVTTIGPGIREIANKWKADGQFLKSYILQVLALEGAEGFAELLHEQIRNMWGIGTTPKASNNELFKAQYQGKRYSFGYPACPRLEDQSKLWGLLKPSESIGVNLTEEYMMDPEGSVSALVFHHPSAKYFTLSQQDIGLLEERITS